MNNGCIIYGYSYLLVLAGQPLGDKTGIVNYNTIWKICGNNYVL